jgi:acetyl-CoA carboxylase biotin carboxyl carrier protein
MDLSEEDVQKILRILDELEYGEIRLEVGELKLHLQKTPAGEARGTTFERAPAAATPADKERDRPAARKRAARAAPVESATLRLVQAPIAGVFYRAPGPGQPPFVRVGQNVSAEDTVCLLEVMKLFQSVAAGVAGRIAEVFVENGEAVNQGQALIAIEILA